MGTWDEPGNTFRISGFQQVAETYLYPDNGVAQLGMLVYVAGADRDAFEAAARLRANETTPGSRVPNFGSPAPLPAQLPAGLLRCLPPGNLNRRVGSFLFTPTNYACDLRLACAALG